MVSDTKLNKISDGRYHHPVPKLTENIFSILTLIMVFDEEDSAQFTKLT